MAIDSTVIIKEDFLQMSDTRNATELGQVTRSYCSRGAPSVDIPEIGDAINLKFIYNFYVPDERVKKTATPEEQLINLKSSTSNEILFEATNDRLPRYVRGYFKSAPNIVFSPTTSTQQAQSATPITDNDAYNLINNIDKIVIEGAGASKFFSGTELIDSLADKLFYNMAELSEIIQDVKVPEDSPLSDANRLANKILNGTLTGESKKLIRSVMGDLQPQGFSYAVTDTQVDTSQASFDSAARQNFSLKFNNLFFYDIVNLAARQSASVFEDEMRAYKSVAQEIQNKCVTYSTPDYIYSDEYQYTAQPLKMESIDELEIAQSGRPADAVYGLTPKMMLAGYIVERYEVWPGGYLQKLEPLILNNPNATFFVDKNIRYGATYLYKVRTIATIEIVTKKINPFNPYLDQWVKGTFLVASQGRTAYVEAAERVPPPPPADINFKFDYKYRKPRIFWSFPINNQRDITRFQIFKRMSIDKPFKLLCEYDFDQSVIKSAPLESADTKIIKKMKFPLLSYIDNSYEPGSSPIYAVAAIDAHGFTSNYSAQFKVTYDKYKNELKLKLISGEGAPKSYPNIYVNKDTFQDLIKTSGKDRMTLVFDPEYYVVQKTLQDNDGLVKDVDLKLIASNETQPTYKIQLINTDLQQSEIINVRIIDKSRPPLIVPASSISKNNLSFEFGIR